MNDRIGLILGVLALIAAIGAGGYFFFFQEDTDGSALIVEDDSPAPEIERQDNDTEWVNPYANSKRDERDADEAEQPSDSAAETTQPKQTKPLSVEPGADEYVPAPTVEEAQPEEEERVALPFSLTIEGRVEDSAKQGVTGATVVVVQGRPAEERTRRWGRQGNNGAEANAEVSKVSGTATSGVDGEFSLNVTGTAMVLKSQQDNPLLEFSLRAEKSGMMPSTTREMSVGLTSGSAALKDITIALYQAGSITGKVVDAGNDQQPFASAEVTLSYFGTWSNEDDAPERVISPQDGKSVVVGADGVFTFTDLHPGNYQVSASIPDMQTSAAGVTVYVEENGRRWGGGEGGARDWVQLEAGQKREDVLLTLQRPGELRFRLAEPAEGVHVKWESQRSNRGFNWNAGGESPFGGGQAVSADQQGVYRVLGIQESHTAVKVRAEGYAEASFPFKDGTKDGNNIDLGTITLEKGATITGIAVDGAGRPIEGVSVAVEQVQNNAGFGGWQQSEPEGVTTTDADGRFELMGAPDGNFQLTLTHDDYAKTEVRAGVDDGKSVDLGRITMTSGASLYGTVQVDSMVVQQQAGGDDNQRGGFGSNSRARVLLVDAASPVLGWAGGNNLSRMAQGIAEYSTTCEEDGGYRIDRISDGNWVAIAIYGDRAVRKDTGEMSGGQEVLLNIQIRAGVRVHGRVTTSVGQGVADQEVRLGENLWGGGERTTTDASGYYEFNDVAEGTWYLKLDGEGNRFDETFRNERAVKVDGNGDVMFNLELDTDGPVLRGTVTLDGESFFRNVSLHTNSGMAPVHQADVDRSDGSWKILGVEPGEYELWYDGWGDGAQRQAFVRVKVGDQPETVLDHAFTSVNVSGTIQSSGDVDFTGASVEFRLMTDEPNSDGSPWRVFDTNVGQDGAFQLDRVVEGRYSITTRVNGFGSSTVKQVISGSDQVVINLELGAKAGSITYEISDVHGEDTALDSGGMSAGQVRLTNAQGEKMELERQASFVMNMTEGTTQTLQSLLPGSYTLTIDHQDFELIERKVKVVAGEDTMVDIEAWRAAAIKITVSNAELSAAEVKSANLTVTDLDGKTVPLASSAFGWGGTGEGEKVLIARVRQSGSYKVTISLKGYADYSFDAHVLRSDTATHDAILAMK